MPLEILQTIVHTIVRYAMSMLISPASATTAISPKRPPPADTHISRRARSLQHLEDEVVRSFGYPCSVRRMLAMSRGLQRQYQQKLQDSNACMLPSLCHTLPTGQETGTFIALDVGGSTFRVALVELSGRAKGQDGMIIHHMAANKIDESVRRLPSAQFFDWMASKIQDMLRDSADAQLQTGVIPLGLTWSFPIEQTSHRSGKMQGMGKGFQCSQDTIGKDLADLMETACRRRGLNIRVEAVVNDGAATLLSQAYLDPSTSMGLILGTGTNAAVYLPTSAVGSSKFGLRDQAWFENAQRVIINTEMSMFGKGVLPETVWDDILNRTHQLPNFQPLEYMTTGRYLGELFRLVLVDAVETCHLFGRVVPEGLRSPYSLDTIILARLEEDESQDLAASVKMIQSAFGLSSPPTTQEVAFLRTVAEAISHRAAAYLAIALHALWALQKRTDINPTTPAGTPKTSIACNGSVVLKYPGFKDRCEDYIAQMISSSAVAGNTFAPERVVLEATDEAALFGAAVAVVLSDAT